MLKLKSKKLEREFNVTDGFYTPPRSKTRIPVWT